MIEVSIIVPVYNAEKYIEKTLESVVNACKSKNKIEIICVNDGSIDNSKDVIVEFIKKNKNIKTILINKENTGVSKTRNIGIENASGKYIMFLDADDELKNNAIDEVIKTLNSYSNIDAILFNYTYVRKSGKVKKRIIFEQQDDFLPIEKIYNESICKNELNNVWQFAISRKFIIDNKIKFKSEYSIGEDLLFNLEIFSNNPNIYYLNKLLYHYNYNTESAMRTLSQEKVFHRIDQTINLYMNYFNYIDRWNVNNQQNKERIAIKLMDRVQGELSNIVILNIKYLEKINLLKRYFNNKSIIEAKKYITEEKKINRRAKYIYKQKVHMYYISTLIEKTIRKILKV